MVDCNMRKGRNKIYIPPKRYNPVFISHKVQELQEQIQKQKDLSKIRIDALEKYFAQLTNFTSHDIKNAIQNMDSVVSTMNTASITPHEIAALKTSLNAIRKSLDDFYKLSPDGRKIEFTLLELSTTLEILNKAAFHKYKISYSFNLDKKDETIIKEPFHSIVQVLNNLIINSIKSVENTVPEKRIYLKFGNELNNIIIEVSDNGIGIPDSHREKIFELYFSTTGGSGIGLAHATFILDGLKGTIKLKSPESGYTTCFEIKFPIQAND
jgi:signal transduction histidine kinase